LKSIFQKKQVSHVHAHTSRAHHAHTHARVHMYTLWPQRSFGTFCYNKVNISNAGVWVRKSANPEGPKKILIPKSAQIVFDVGVGSLKM